MLTEDAVPVGTCFQVAPGVLVTAWHVLDSLGCGDVGAFIRTDALGRSGPSAPAEVRAVDPACDLAVLRRATPLEESVAGWAPTDAVDLPTKTLVTGLAGVDDPGHSYAFLNATGEWQGWTVRDGVALGRLSSSSVVPGMSGAPVVRMGDGLVLGVVSARYNSADNWLRDSVWVARTEDLTRLLEGSCGLGVRRRLVLGDRVGTVLSAHGLPAAAALPRADGVGPMEAAREAALVLTALDHSCRRMGAPNEALDLLVSQAIGAGWSAREADGLRNRLRLRGLEPRVLLPSLADHEEAVGRWAAPFPGAHPDDGLSGHAARAFLAGLRQLLVRELGDGILAELSEGCRRFLRQALEGGGALPLSGFLHALLSRLPGVRSASTEVVLTTPRNLEPGHPGGTVGERESLAGRDPATAGGPVPGRPELGAVAAQMSRLPRPDPCTAGRENLVAAVVGAIDRRMTQHGAATAFLSGQPGVGASLVAVEAARALAPAFPGGVFHVDLHGLVPEACRNARTVVRILAEALGLHLGDEAMDDARLIASFTAQLPGRRVLLVLDNARDAAHVRPFTPAPEGCGIIVTSRDRAQGYADPGLVFEVGPLERSASVEVLTRCAEGRDLGAGGDGSSAALHRLAHLCDDVPLALRIVGARLAHPSGPAPAYLVQLLEEESARLDTLSYGDRAVRLAIRLSHDALDPDARRVLRLVVAAPGAAVTGAELGHCLQAPALRQELLLNRLADRSLAFPTLVRMPAGELLATFRLFDLVRLFAAERLAEDEPPDAVREFRHACVSYLSARLAEITDQEYGAQLTGELDPSRFHAALRLAKDNEWLDLAAELAVGLHVLYSARGELDAIVGVNEDRVALHLRQGRPEEAVKACLLNADTLRSASAAGPAADAARRAAGIAREYGLHDRVAEAEFKLSLCRWEQEEWAEALAAGDRAVTTLTSAGRGAAAVPIAINNSRIARRTDDLDLAVRWGRRALDLAERWGTAEYRAMAANECGLTEENAGNLAAALELYRRSAAAQRAFGNHENAAIDYANAASMAARLADPATAVHLLSEAVELWQQAENHPRALESLIDLSALHVEQDAYEQAARFLTRAARLARAEAAHAPALLRAEVLTRHAAIRLFDASLDAEPVEPQSALAEDTELTRVHNAVEHHRAGALGLRQAQKQTRPLLTSWTRNTAPRNDPWVYEELGAEAAERRALGT